MHLGEIENVGQGWDERTLLSVVFEHIVGRYFAGGIVPHSIERNVPLGFQKFLCK